MLGDGGGVSGGRGWELAWIKSLKFGVGGSFSMANISYDHKLKEYKTSLF